MIEAIDHVQVAAPPASEAEARAFYGELLGLEELPKPEALAGRGGVWFALGAQELHVGIEQEFAPARKAHPAFRVRGLNELRTRLDRAGVETDEQGGIPGVRRFHVHDPFGNRLEFVEPA